MLDSRKKAIVLYIFINAVSSSLRQWWIKMPSWLYLECWAVWTCDSCRQFAVHSILHWWWSLSPENTSKWIFTSSYSSRHICFIDNMKRQKKKEKEKQNKNVGLILLPLTVGSENWAKKYLNTALTCYWNYVMLHSRKLHIPVSVVPPYGGIKPVKLNLLQIQSDSHNLYPLTRKIRVSTLWYGKVDTVSLSFM